MATLSCELRHLFHVPGGRTFEIAPRVSKGSRRHPDERLDIKEGQMQALGEQLVLLHLAEARPVFASLGGKASLATLRRGISAMPDIPEHRSIESNERARGSLGNQSCSRWRLSSAGCRHQTTTNPSRHPRACSPGDHSCYQRPSRTNLKRLFVADGTRRHGSRRRRVNLFDQHSAVREMSGLSVCRHRARRSVDGVQLFGASPLISRDRPAPKKLVGCSVVRRNMDIAVGVDCGITNDSRPRRRRSRAGLRECGYRSKDCKPQCGYDRCPHPPSAALLSDGIL